MKYGITPTVTLDLAINPDFVQVEAAFCCLCASVALVRLKELKWKNPPKPIIKLKRF